VPAGGETSRRACGECCFFGFREAFHGERGANRAAVDISPPGAEALFLRRVPGATPGRCRTSTQEQRYEFERFEHDA
jgi:hypothetical protein